jgi:hypothetical protein
LLRKRGGSVTLEVGEWCVKNGMNGSYEATMGGSIDGAEKKGNSKSPIAIQKDTLQIVYVECQSHSSILDF